jgi:hypothetical protein
VSSGVETGSPVASPTFTVAVWSRKVARVRGSSFLAWILKVLSSLSMIGPLRTAFSPVPSTEQAGTTAASPSNSSYLTPAWAGSMSISQGAPTFTVSCAS